MRRFGLILVGVMLLTACGDSSNKKADTISATAVTQVAPAVPSTATATAVASTSSGAGTLTIASTTAPVAPAPEPTTMPSPTPTHVERLPAEDDLQPLMLTLSDMPVGWTIDPDAADDSDADTPLCGHTSEEDADDVDTTVGFKKSDLGPFISENLAVYKGDQAKQWFKNFKDAFTCTDDTIPGDDGTPTPVHYAPLSFPNLGDETFALRMSVEAGLLGSVPVDLVFVRDGNKVVSVSNFSIGDIDSDLTQSLTQKAVDRATGK